MEILKFSIPGSFLVHSWDSWDSSGIHQELVGECKDLVDGISQQYEGTLKEDRDGSEWDICPDPDTLTGGTGGVAVIITIDSLAAVLCRKVGGSIPSQCDYLGSDIRKDRGSHEGISGDSPMGFCPDVGRETGPNGLPATSARPW
jgi:hypothetical protein